MMNEKICSGCGETKKLEDFPTRGSEKDPFGNPIFKAKCKVCDSNRNTARYHANKALNSAAKANVEEQPLLVITEYPPFVPKSKTPGKLVKNDEDYTPWEERKGRPLTDEEKIELDNCARELIISMMDLVIKDKEKKDECIK
ncbi:MAG: hypothetical protein PHY93_08580 [Bacteriovorax sp.]|nr:hypothetical protein [Bacteriovorax sp.]